jgi:putative phosphoesterase
MRLAIISDTHLPKGRRVLPAACLDRLAAADAILHCGDFNARSVYEELLAIGPPLHAVHGNVDPPELWGLLPETLEIELGGVRIAMVHDSGPAAGRMKRMRTRFPHADLVVFGHSHLPLLQTSPEGMTLLNPGSPTERRRAPRHTMAQADVADGAVVCELLALD